MTGSLSEARDVLLGCGVVSEYLQHLSNLDRVYVLTGLKEGFRAVKSNTVQSTGGFVIF